MPSDVAPLLRRNEPKRWTKPLARRPDSQLPFDAAAVGRGSMILLDATVYIDALQDKLPRQVQALLARATIVHAGVVRAEFAFSIGCLDPRDPRTPRRRTTLERLLDRMPERRCFAPSNDAWLQAAVLAGILARIQGHAGHDRRKLLNDALILMTARERGATLVTRNIADMDFLSALRPDAKLLLYRV